MGANLHTPVEDVLNWNYSKKFLWQPNNIDFYFISRDCAVHCTYSPILFTFEFAF